MGQLLQEEGTGLELTLGRRERARSFPFSRGRDVGAPLCLSTKSIPAVWGAGDGAGRSQHCQEEVLVPGTVLEAQILPSDVCPEPLQAAGADPQCPSPKPPARAAGGRAGGRAARPGLSRESCPQQ